MNELASVFINSLLPVFIASGASYPLGKWLKVSPRPLSQATFYLFSPCLIFTLLTENHLSGGDMVHMMAFTIAIDLLLGSLAWLAGKALCLNRPVLMAVLLTVLFNNSGNMGLPVISFAFGQDALAQATIFFITSLILTHTVGVVIASMGTASIRKSILGLFKLPSVYAVTLALLVITFGWQLPLPLDRIVHLFSDAAIPCMMVLLGLQLQGADWKGYQAPLALSAGLRLLVSPLLALVLAPLFGLQGAAYQGGVLQSAMPSAVLTTVLATEFNALPSFVTATVLISTLLSPLVLTPLIVLLK